MTFFLDIYTNLTFFTFCTIRLIKKNVCYVKKLENLMHCSLRWYGNSNLKNTENTKIHTDYFFIDDLSLNFYEIGFI